MDAFFDIYSGISGNMVLGALVDLGLDPVALGEKLAALGLEGEFELEVNGVNRSGITGTHVQVVLSDSEGQHAHRHFSEIKDIIESSALPPMVKKKAVDIFRNLALAEASVHGVEMEEIHFHEVGAVDAIVDIVGSVLGLEMLGIDKIYASSLHTGTGFVDCEHGRIPVPAPATVELLAGVPVYSRGIEAELVTPTGAAIISTLAEDFGPRPQMKIEKTGYGAGSRELEIPNFLRVHLGQVEVAGGGGDRVSMVECNIDDMQPEIYEYVMERLFAAGALDVFLTPLQMKKNRPGIKLSVLVENVRLDEIVDIILTETTTLGVRIFEDLKRVCLQREIDEVSTPWGDVRIKLACKGEEVVNVAPEYEDCRDIARGEGLPLKEVYERVKEMCKDYY